MTAVLVIDMLNEFFTDGRLFEHKESLITHTNALIDAARKKQLPIIWVRQEYADDLSDAPLYNRRNQKKVTIAGTQGAQILPELHQDPNDIVIVKKRYSAFFKTNLDDVLDSLDINRLIIAGVNTMSCVRMAAIDAYQRDIEVLLALDCVDGHDKEQHESSLVYLQYAVATGVHNDEILLLP